MKGTLPKLLSLAGTGLLLVLVLLLARYSRPAVPADFVPEPAALSAAVTRTGAGDAPEERTLSLPWEEAEEVTALLAPLSLHRAPLNPIRSLLGLSRELRLKEGCAFTLTLSDSESRFDLRYDGEDWYYSHDGRQFLPCTVSGVDPEALGELLWDMGAPQT